MVSRSGRGGWAQVYTFVCLSLSLSLCLSLSVCLSLSLSLSLYTYIKDGPASGLQKREGGEGAAQGRFAGAGGKEGWGQGDGKGRREKEGAGRIGDHARPYDGKNWFPFEDPAPLSDPDEERPDPISDLGDDGPVSGPANEPASGHLFRARSLSLSLSLYLSLSLSLKDGLVSGKKDGPASGRGDGPGTGAPASTPYTTHPTPYTLHPTPHTPHPSLYTLRLLARSLSLSLALSDPCTLLLPSISHVHPARAGLPEIQKADQPQIERGSM